MASPWVKANFCVAYEMQIECVDTLNDFLSVCLLFLIVSRGGVDPNQREDVSGDAHLLLLHLWSADPCRACLLAKRLEEVAVGRLCTPLPILCLQLVSGNLWEQASKNRIRCHFPALSLIRWYAESARWLALNRRSDKALKNLHRVARINGRPTSQLTIEVSCLLAVICDHLW